MGIWGFLCSIGDSLKGWCSSARGYGSAVVTEINNGRIKATQKLSDKKTRAKIAPIAVDLAKNAAIYSCQEGLKSIPGGTLIYKIVSRSICGKKNSSIKPRRKRRQRAQAKMEESDDEKSEDLERVEKDDPCADLKTQSAIYLKSKL